MPRHVVTSLVFSLLITEAAIASDYASAVLSDGPCAYWRFEEAAGPEVRDHSGNTVVHRGMLRDADLTLAGPRPKRFPDFSPSNSGAYFDGNGNRITIADPGATSPFDFALGDSITIEAWVDPLDMSDGQFVYLVGKGRTHNKGFAANNQNWSLRLRSSNGLCKLSFLFRDADNRPASHSESKDDWHRWTSQQGFAPSSGWHHVAVVFSFGTSDSLRAVIDGENIQGSWDMGGATDEAPVVDDDDIWIGSSMGGNPGSSLEGGIDEVAIYRKAVPLDRLRSRYRHIELPSKSTPPPDSIPEGIVVVEIIEGIPSGSTWRHPDKLRAESRWEQSSFSMPRVPRKYSNRGLIIDRSAAILIRMSGKIRVAEGDYDVLLRSFNAARLWIDDRLVASTPFKSRNADGHEEVPPVAEARSANIRLLPVGHAEKLVELALSDGEHVVRLEAIVGGKGLRHEIGELALALRSSGSSPEFQVLSPREAAGFVLDDESWELHATKYRQFIERREADLRRSAQATQAEYWARRHERAREFVAKLPRLKIPEVSLATPSNNAIDQFLTRRLEAAGVAARESIDDMSYLRRLSLDLRGTAPTLDEVEAFRSDSDPKRRERCVERWLSSPSWADHWVPYWQDVLAENPGILKPKLNNTGPFRWWIHESFLDGKPIDQFVTELVLMEGSKYAGGPAGFAMSTQNDVPMAAKAHVLGTAFLGIDLKCARCHDAPFHPYKQEDLFNLAAMLGRGPQKVPVTSSIPLPAEELEDMIVEVTLKPGSEVAPAWPFERFGIGQETTDVSLHRPGDSRERLAAILTSPENNRFARVVANRLWKRYMGWGLVEPVDDWEGIEASHPDLLEYLGRELMANNYDLKHLAKLILNSHAYQRVASGDEARPPPPAERLFAGPARRRLNAEQIVDTLFASVGKTMDTEALNFDVDGRRPLQSFLNLGAPRRAWEFASLSNERDRPALAIPRAQNVTDVLKTFGWRESRQDPRTTRDHSPTPLQPLILANGVVSHHAITLSDEGNLSDLCIETENLDELIRSIYSTLLTRSPSNEELDIFRSFLSEGFSTRVRPEAKRHRKRRKPNAVSWSNHLSAEATRIKLELERAAILGEPPTARLEPGWRERMEDLIWTLINSPEFVFIP